MHSQNLKRILAQVDVHYSNSMIEDSIPIFEESFFYLTKKFKIGMI